MPKAAVDGLVIIAGNVLLVKRKKKPFKSHLALPGGFLQPYESYEHALKREVKEETGIDADIINIIGLIVQRKGMKEMLQVLHIYASQSMQSTC